MSLTLGNNGTTYVDHGDITAINGASALTLAFWVAVDAAVSGGPIEKGALRLFEMGGDRSYQIREVGLWQLNSDLDAVPADILNWNHFAAVFDGSLAAASRITVYKNAVPLSLSGTYPGATLSSSASALQIGNANTSGLHAHLRLWAAACTQAEIAQEMHRYWACRQTTLLLDAPYDDQVAARDYSGNGNHGTWSSALSPVIQAQGPPVSYGGKVLVTG